MKNSNRQVKAIIFDCDGTLVDSEYAHFLTWQHAVEKQGGRLTLEDYAIYAGKCLQTNAELMARNTGCKCALTIAEDKISYFEKLQKKGFPSIAPTVDFVRNLANNKQDHGLKLGVASAAPKFEILANLRHHRLEDFFDIILSGKDDLDEYSDAEGVNKPKPYIYLHAAKQLGVLPSECVVIEDSHTGVTAGVNAGCITVAVPNRYTAMQDFTHAHFKLESFAGIDIAKFMQMISNYDSLFL